MRKLLLLCLLFGCSPVYKTYHIPVTAYEDEYGVITNERILWVEWMSDTTFDAWGLTPRTSACLEYWPEWTRYDDHGPEGGWAAVVTGVRIKSVVTFYNKPRSEVTAEEWLACVQLEEKRNDSRRAKEGQ